MPISPLAGKPAPRDMLIDVAALVREYHERTPDLAIRRNSSPSAPAAIAARRCAARSPKRISGAITQAICDYRRDQQYHRPGVHGQRHACSFRPGAEHGA